MINKKTRAFRLGAWGTVLAFAGFLGHSTAKVGLAQRKDDFPQRFTGEELFRGIFFGDGRVAEMLPEIWKDPKVTAPDVNPMILAARVREAAARKAMSSDDASRGSLTYRAPGCGFEGRELCPPTALSDALEFTADQIESRDLSAEEVQARFTEFMADRRAQDVTVARIRLERPLFFPQFALDVESGNPFRVARALELGVDLALTSRLPAFIFIDDGPPRIPPRPFFDVDFNPLAEPAVEIETAIYAVVFLAVAVFAVLVVFLGAEYGSTRLARTALVADITETFAVQPLQFPGK